ncbi:MAG: Forkhead-associated [uncultured Thermomicrobiales bacterium]|uniref:Forkhead-associated n=1 Tax=uncultured Thermomicrobiales bacterium TaxID=1645740 RepID=A0A6J4UUF9_9BACT|nr:MAG: Forkhead-associated [uncultured Thermomicrobiales bacterium]
MNIFEKFEQSFERLMEGSVGRLFRSPIQPAEIGRKLERAMISRQVVSVDGTLVPNDFRVTMHPLDMVQFADYMTSLTKQMEAWITETAQDRGFKVVDRVRVQIAADQGVPRRAIQITAAIADRPAITPSAQEQIQRTEVFRVIRETSGITPVRLLFVDGPRKGEEVVLRKAVTTLGRALDNDIIFETGDVSRHHARLEFVEQGLKVIDLDSTNGTRVNGKVIRSHPVQVGDEVTFGTLKASVLPYAGKA